MNELPAGPLRIALVEDEDAHAEAIRRAFADAGSSAEITAVGTLREFRVLLAGAPPDLAVLDMNLPDGTAVEVLTSPPEAGRFPILVMTSYGNQTIAVEAMKAGAFDYVVKSEEVFREMPRIAARALREWRLLRERAEAGGALRESETRFRQMAEAMSETFWLRDLRTKQILYINPAFETLWGRSRESLYANPDLFLESVHPEDRARVAETAALLSNSEIPFSFSEEYRIVRPDGSVRWVQTRIHPVFDEQRAAIRYAGFAEDITTARRAQEALLESEEKYRRLSRQFHALLDAIPEDITVQTQDFTVIWANRAAAAKMGSEPEQMLGQPCHLLRFERTEPCEPCPLLESLRTREPAVAIMSSPGGRVFEARAIPVIEAGEIINIINVVRDITVQTRMEEQLRQAQKIESIGTLAGGVAHDFNNILASIIGYGHMAMLKSAPDAQARPHIQHMLDGADRAAKLTEGLLAFSRKQRITRTPVDIVALVRRAAHLLSRTAGERVHCLSQLPAAELWALADPNQIEQVLVNLVANARDATAESGDCTIAVERVQLDPAAAGSLAGAKAGAYTVITVTDTGAGMSEQVRARVFEPFFTTKEVGKGTGLGLSIVHGIVKQHEGFVDLKSRPGAGTTVRVFLPAIPAPEVREQQRPPAADVRGTETILLADDESAVRLMTRSVLEEYGYRVVAASNGEEAVRLFRDSPDEFDLLLFDVVMPTMGGKDAFDSIRRIRPTIPALFMSGYSDDFVHRREVMGAAMSVLHKPVSPIDLLAKVRALLTAARASRPSPPRAGAAPAPQPDHPEEQAP